MEWEKSPSPCRTPAVVGSPLSEDLPSRVQLSAARVPLQSVIVLLSP